MHTCAKKSREVPKFGSHAYKRTIKTQTFTNDSLSLCKLISLAGGRSLTFQALLFERGGQRPYIFDGFGCGASLAFPENQEVDLFHLSVIFG